MVFRYFRIEATSNPTNPKTKQPQLTVRLHLVGFSSVLVIFSVQSTRPSNTTLGPFFVFLIIQHCIHHLHLLFLFHAHHPLSCTATTVLVMWLLLYVSISIPVIILWWLSFSSMLLSSVPSLSVSVLSCDIVFVIMAHLLFIIVPSPSLLCQLLIPPHEQMLIAVA